MLTLKADRRWCSCPPLFSSFRQSFCRMLLSRRLWTKTESERERLLALLPGAYEQSCSLVHDLRTIAAKAERWVAEMDFGFLLHQRRKLLSVGYHLKNRTLDSACYDLLASEARIAAFIAIGKGDVPQETWSRLGQGARAGTGWSPDPDLVGRNDVRIPDAGDLDALSKRHDAAAEYARSGSGAEGVCR